MIDGKSWLQSKTIWGALVASAGVIGMVVKFDIAATLSDIETLASLGTTSAGIILAIVGRFKAKQKIS